MIIGTDPPQLEWTQTTPSTWERDADPLEVSYYLPTLMWEGCGRMFFAQTGFVNFSVDSGSSCQTTIDKIEQRVDDSLRKSWITLRHNHPSLASRIEYNKDLRKLRRIYQMPQTQAELESWLDKTFRLVKTSVSGLEWCNSDPPASRLPTLFILANPSSITGDGRIQRSVVFRSPHDVLDGVGTLMLLNNFFKLVSQTYDQPSSYQLPAFGDEAVNLSPPLSIAAAIPFQWTAAQEEQYQQLKVWAKTVFGAPVERCFVPFKHGAQYPGVHKRHALTLSKESTMALISKCKSLGVTVTHAYHTAVAMELSNLQRVSAEPRLVRYFPFCLVNHRNDCIESYHAVDHPVSNMHSSSMEAFFLDLPGPCETTRAHRASENHFRAEFQQALKDISTFYRSVQSSKNNLLLVPEHVRRSLGEMSYEVLSGEQHFELPRAGTAPNVSLSSKGRLDDLIAPRHGSLELHDVWTTGEELRNDYGLFLDSFRGRLTLACAYNDAWHDRDEVELFLRRCHGAVPRGLGMEEEPEMSTPYPK